MRDFVLGLVTLVVLLSFSSNIEKKADIIKPEDPKALTITRLMVKEKKRRRKDYGANHHKRQMWR